MNKDMKQTTIDWLVEQISYKTTTGEVITYHKDITDLLQQAKEMEKQQKEVDYQSGFLDCYTKIMSERLTRNV
jgi:predicted nucleic acid-binding protein